MILLAAFTAGCGDSNDRIVRTGTPEIKTLPDGRLSVDPAPLTVEEVARQPKGSPQAVVYQLWFFGQWGSGLNAIDLYDPRVVRTIGRSQMIDAFAAARSDMLASRIQVAGVFPGPTRTLVAASAASHTQRPTTYSFVLRRSKGAWHIIWDTLLETGLAQAAGKRISPQTDAPPSPAAQRAAAAASRPYRALAARLGANP